MPTLFQIADDLRALADLLAEGDAELADETAAAADAWFAELSGHEETKLDAYVGLIRRFEMEEAAAKAERDQYDMIARARGNAAARLKQRLHDYFIATGRTKIVTASARTIRVQANGTAPLDVDRDLDLTTLPPDLVKTTTALNAAELYRRIKAGESFPFARLGERGSHLRIA